MPGKTSAESPSMPDTMRAQSRRSSPPSSTGHSAITANIPPRISPKLRSCAGLRSFSSIFISFHLPTAAWVLDQVLVLSASARTACRCAPPPLCDRGEGKVRGQFSPIFRPTLDLEITQPLSRHSFNEPLRQLEIGDQGDGQVHGLPADEVIIR